MAKYNITEKKDKEYDYRKHISNNKMDKMKKKKLNIIVREN